MRPRTSGGKQQPRCFRGLSHRESAALPVGWALEPTRIQPTDNRQATAPLTADHTALETQLLHSKKTLRIMRLPGRLVQLVRILGRHPRGRRFESCTAHQRHFKQSQSPSRFCREKAQQCLFCAGQLDQIPSSPRYCEKCATRVHIPPIILLRQAPLRAILAGLGMDWSFSNPYFFLVVKQPPPNRRWEWRKNEPGPSRSQGWHDAHLHG